MTEQQKLEIQARAAGLNIGSDKYGNIMLLDGANREITCALTVQEARKYLGEILKGE